MGAEYTRTISNEVILEFWTKLYFSTWSCRVCLGTVSLLPRVEIVIREPRHEDFFIMLQILLLITNCLSKKTTSTLCLDVQYSAISKPGTGGGIGIWFLHVIFVYRKILQR